MHQGISKQNTKQVTLETVKIGQEEYLKISNCDKMRPFFMSIVSDSNHWMFIGSNGGLSAGRKDPENALFPYYTDDKIIESNEMTGSKTIVRIENNGQFQIWEPFSVHFANLYRLKRNLYKNVYGDKILFEEINEDLNLTFRYQWSTSDKFGFVKTSSLTNLGAEEAHISILDGIQNIMPYGVGSALQGIRSNLVDAYKRSELEKESGLGIFALSAIIVDKAEPSEALKASVAWSLGIPNAKRLLSSSQLEPFRNGQHVVEETDVKAEKGAYFVQTELTLSAGNQKEWMLIADINQNASQIVALAEAIKNDKNLASAVKEDIKSGTRQLVQLNAAADGLQLTADHMKDTRHFANSMFNIMRGGIFDKDYQIERGDFLTYLKNANTQVFGKHIQTLKTLPNEFSRTQLQNLTSKTEDNDLKRLCLEYLPLKFSRRHGDPSRPWNQFSINTRNEHDGSKVLDYAGNWRDIFQNWEALALSYPEFIDGMIFKFLNASTFDGYNPYRITKNGIDWEKIEADDPWSYIGYWGDHQIIYLLKFLEFSERHAPGKLESYFDQDMFVYANVPYKIKPYEDILRNPKDTIDFDHKLDHAIQHRWSQLGADAALLQNKTGAIHHVNFLEKILATVLAKVSNFIPEGGIWMNTQRPEWNDANNALVGNGVSMVTLFYLRRFLTFFNSILAKSPVSEVHVSEEVLTFFQQIHQALITYQHLLYGPINDKNRKAILDALGTAGSQFRNNIYSNTFSNHQKTLKLSDIIEFSNVCLSYLEHSIRANKRRDSLYHSYNLMTVENETEVSISYLSEMLEGQVAVLSSGYLTSSEALETLESLKKSDLFRKDQYSYLLYPNKDLPGFLQKNNIPKSEVAKSALLSSLSKDKDKRIIEQDVKGDFHFNGNFKNASDLQSALDSLEIDGQSVSESSKKEVLQIFETVFNHKAFTGRSGTFYGYEGLGSIYWHMVSKLQLAVMECCQKAIKEKAPESVVNGLIAHYYEINEGIGVHKSPSLYGAFPTDPYSHTPANKGAQQPGMTGQVKEDIISRFGELGVSVVEGRISFEPRMLRKSEFLSSGQTFRYVDLSGASVELALKKNSLAFTYCQVPVVYHLASENRIEVILKDGSSSQIKELSLGEEISAGIFSRTGNVIQLEVHLEEAMLR
ncbi:hypothetical protein C943_01650 [Mariniradius saccharolyticus AK6]|uniref:Glycosyl hydrolase 36 catalytic domain-containing protein n=1 Tax=Mariniradius saccharolyticus AK6 TaxID=1239962 RepID=M7X371_9BACT|nr:hypothetical protein [Mariniradius saccharolyticus]EMS31915.1 hypothetical protein C943_01650 [Mariniradius saccharolyticus AK6]